VWKCESATLRLGQPVHVLIAYGTSLVRDGRVYFYDDIYGYDRQLDVALRSIGG
jgi:L,D-transpeptidase YcbB